MSRLSDFCGAHSLAFRPPVVRTDSAPNPLSNNETSKIRSLHETKPFMFYNDAFLQDSALANALDNHEIISEETCTSYFSDEVHTLSEPSLPNDEYLCTDAIESFPVSLDSDLHTQALYAVTISDTQGFNLDSGAFNSSTSFVVGANSGLSFVDLEPNSCSNLNCSEAHCYCNTRGETVQPFASEFCPTFQPYADEPFVVQNSEFTYPTTLSTTLTTEQNYFLSHTTTQNADFRCCAQSAVVNSMVAETSREKDATVSTNFIDPVEYCLTSDRVSTDHSHYDQLTYANSAYNKFACSAPSAPAMKNDHTVMCCQVLPSQDLTYQYYRSTQYSVDGPCQFTEQAQPLDQFGSDALPSQLHNDLTPAFYYNAFDNFSGGNSLDKLQNSAGLSGTLQRSPHENLGISELDYWVTDCTDPTAYKHLHSYPSLSNLDHWPESARLTDESHCNLDRTKQDIGPFDPRPGHLCVPHFSDGVPLVPARTTAHVPSESLPPLQPYSSYAVEHSLNPAEATLANRTCPHCTHTFTRPSHLEAHLHIHTGGRPHRCVLCGRQFTQASNLRRHLSSHKTWPPIPPGKRSTSRVWISPGSQDPPGCTPVALTKRVYGKRKTWICRFCHWQVDTYSQLRRHMVYHKESRVYACVFEACLNTFPSPEELLSHLIEGHRIGAENQSCPSCGEQFEDVKQLVQHWLPRRRGLPPRCVRRNPKHTQADDLHLALTRDRLRNGLSKHSRSLLSRIRLLALRKPNERLSVRAYRCPLCPRRCHALSRLRQHLESAHGDTLVSAVEEPIKSTHPNETDGSPPRCGLSADCPTSHQSTTLSPVVGRCVPKSTSSKTVLFLLHVDEDKSAAVVRKGSATSSTFAARKRNRNSSSPLSCQHCGKAFQKLKFFTDHQQLCQQRIEERERRSRLQAHRRAGFKVSTDSASLSVDDGLCVSCPDVAPTLKLSSSEVSTEITGPNLRRSGRSKQFRPLWKPKSERSNPKRTLLNETFSINREMSNIPTSVIHQQLTQ